MKNPKFQREDGDWINFKIPNTDLSIPMIQSGFGDGQYPVYFGYDEKGNLCDIVLEFPLKGSLKNWYGIIYLIVLSHHK